MTQRTEQVASLIRNAVQSTVSRGLHDPRIRGLISITQVTVSADLSWATVYVSVLPAEHGALTLHGLRHAASRIRSQLGRAVRLRHVPRLSFELDDSIKKQSEVLAALAEDRRAEECPPGDTSATSQTEESVP